RAGAPDPKVAGADRDLLGGFRPREPDSICILRIDVEGTVDSEQTCRIRSVQGDPVDVDRGTVAGQGEADREVRVGRVRDAASLSGGQWPIVVLEAVDAVDRVRHK